MAESERPPHSVNRVPIAVEGMRLRALRNYMLAAYAKDGKSPDEVHIVIEDGKGRHLAIAFASRAEAEEMIDLLTQYVNLVWPS